MVVIDALHSYYYMALYTILGHTYYDYSYVSHHPTVVTRRILSMLYSHIVVHVNTVFTPLWLLYVYITEDSVVKTILCSVH